jgi:hypothetical protein
MGALDRIKAHHLIEFVGVGIRVGQAAEMYETLSPSEREQLDEYVRALQEYRAQRGRQQMNRLLLEVVCMAFSVEEHPHGEGASRLRLGELAEGTGARNIGAEAYTVERVHRALRRYAALPAADREELVRHAASLGIDLPADAESQLLKLLTALARLGDSELRGGRLDRSILLEAYRQISLEEGRRLARDIIRIWRTDREAYLEPDWRMEREAAETSTVAGPLIHLACLVPGSLRGCHGDLIEAGMFYPHELYRDADAAARDDLVRLLETPPHCREALGPLAWIGDEVIQETFHRWRQSPPDWAPDLGWSIENYFIRDAGWELTQTGRRRDLYHRQCYRLIPAGEAALADTPGPVGVGIRHKERCRWCGQQLVTLFDLDLRDRRLTFLAPGWNRLRIAMCNRCKPYGTIFTEVDGDGSSRWGNLNARPEYLHLGRQGWQFPQRPLVLGPIRRSPYEARFDVISQGISQIGGFPTWEQGNSHPHCPRCGHWMVFVGQVETSDALGGRGEGVTYAFLCQDCGMAATAYEQT